MAKFVIKDPRFLDGQYIHASPEEPAIIELPDGYKPKENERLYPADSAEAAKVDLKPHFARRTRPSDAVAGPTFTPAPTDESSDEKSSSRKRGRDKDTI